MKTYRVSYEATGLCFGIVVARFNEPICERLLEGCFEELTARGASPEDLHVAWVPGAFEIPQVARAMAETGRYDAIVALGAVIRGDTAHFDYVCRAVTDGVREVIRDTDVPIGFGVLTTEDTEQALARAGGEEGNKGADVALAALEMVHLMSVIDEPPDALLGRE